MINLSKIVHYNGKNYYFWELLTEKGLMDDYDAIWKRLKDGWSVRRAIDKPVNRHKK
jgi:hypothetical protein